jgi:hypothetical protein
MFLSSCASGNDAHTIVGVFETSSRKLSQHVGSIDIPGQILYVGTPINPPTKEANEIDLKGLTF